MTPLSAVATRVRGGYRVPLAERTRRITDGLAERKASGRWTGRVPYGYLRPSVAIGGQRLWADHLEPDPVTAPIVARIFAEALGGATGRRIAERLNGDGVSSWTGGQWTGHLVSKLIRSPTYLGRWGAPALVDPETAALLRWPRPRRPLAPPTEWARRLAAMSPERLAELRQRNRESQRRRRNAIASTTTDTAGRRGVPSSDRPPAVHPPEHKGDTAPWPPQ